MARHQQTSRPIIRTLCVALLVIGAGWGWQQLKNPEYFPIRTVKVQASYVHIPQEKLAEILTPFASQGFFGLSGKKLKAALLSASPWVAQVDIRKIWPDGLAIHITEQVPVAQWENKGLINAEGEIFHAPPATFPGGLPILAGEASDMSGLLTDYAKMQVILKPTGMRILEVKLSDRQAITLLLSDGTKIIVGRKDPLPRLQRFAKVYPKIFRPEGKAEVIDLRYEHGVSVKWQ